MRKTRTHYATAHRFLSWPVTACDQSSFHTMTDNPAEVDCRRCLYQMGLYMPLVKLREHQHAMKRARERELHRRAQNFNASGNPEYTQ